MENLNDLKNGMDVLIQKMELELSSLKQARLLLNAKPVLSANENGITPNEQFVFQNRMDSNVVALIQKTETPFVNSISNTFKTDYNKQNKRGRKKLDIGNEYPIYGKGTEKLRYILHSQNRTISETEFRNEIIKYEGIEAEVLSSLDRILRGLSHPETGEWTYFTFSKMGEKFFILPEWRDNDEKTVYPKYRCDVAIAGLNPNFCNWNQLIWHRDK